MTRTKFTATCVEDIVAFARECAECMPQSLIYRGQSVAGLPLRPKIYRYGQLTKYTERRIAEQFRLNAVSRALRCPDYGDLASWVTLMQHFGAPTRLLDWTNSVTVAAYFACEGADESPGKDGELFALSPRGLNLEAGIKRVGRFTLAGVSNYLRQCFIDPEHRTKSVVNQYESLETRIFVAIAPEVDLRLLVQQAAFTVHPPSMTELARPTQTDSSVLRVLRVPASSKTAILSQLKACGVSRSALFPDLATLGDDLTRRLQSGEFGEKSE